MSYAVNWINDHVVFCLIVLGVLWLMIDRWLSLSLALKYERGKNRDLEQRINTLTETAKQNQHRNMVLEATVERKQRTNTELDETIGSFMEIRWKNLQTIVTLYAITETRRKRIADLEKGAKSEQKKIEGIEKVLESKNDRIKVLEDRVEARQQKIAQLKDVAQNSQILIDTLQGDAQLKEKEWKNREIRLEENANRLTVEVTRNKTLIAGLETRLTKQGKDLNRREDEFKIRDSNLRRQIEDFEMKRATFETRQQEMERQLTAREAHFETVTKDVDLLFGLLEELVLTSISTTQERYTDSMPGLSSYAESLKRQWIANSRMARALDKLHGHFAVIETTMPLLEETLYEAIKSKEAADELVSL